VPTIFTADGGIGSVILWRSTDGAATFTKDIVALPRPNETDGFATVAVATDGTVGVAWARLAGEVVLSTRAPGANAWTTPAFWSLPGQVEAIGPALLARSDGGFVMSYANQTMRDDNMRYGDLALAWGNTHGDVAGHRVLERDQLFAGRGVNGDFATLAALPDGRYASALVELKVIDADNYDNWVEVLVAGAV
jgi:hypothetical protein